MKVIKQLIVIPLIIAIALVIGVGDTFAAEKNPNNPNDYIDTKVSETTKKNKDHKSKSDISTQYIPEDPGSTNYTKTVTITRTYYSLAGLAVAKHHATTWWTYGSNYLYSSPKGYDNDWWTSILNYKTGDSGKWDWYNTGTGGSGRSNLQVTFEFGVPTPWGPIGSTYSSRIYTTVRSDGTYSY